MVPHPEVIRGQRYRASHLCLGRAASHSAAPPSLVCGRWWRWYLWGWCRSLQGISLVDLIQYMTKEEQAAYIAQLGLMIKNLDYYFDDMEVHHHYHLYHYDQQQPPHLPSLPMLLTQASQKNVAVEVFRENKGEPFNKPGCLLPQHEQHSCQMVTCIAMH